MRYVRADYQYHPRAEPRAFQPRTAAGCHHHPRPDARRGRCRQRQDERAHHAHRAPAVAGRGPRKDPRAHVHQEGRRRDAQPHHLDGGRRRPPDLHGHVPLGLHPVPASLCRLPQLPAELHRPGRGRLARDAEALHRRDRDFPPSAERPMDPRAGAALQGGGQGIPPEDHPLHHLDGEERARDRRRLRGQPRAPADRPPERPPRNREDLCRLPKCLSPHGYDGFRRHPPVHGHPPHELPRRGVHHRQPVPVRARGRVPGHERRPVQHPQEADPHQQEHLRRGR